MADFFGSCRKVGMRRLIWAHIFWIPFLGISHNAEAAAIQITLGAAPTFTSKADCVGRLTAAKANLVSISEDAGSQLTPITDIPAFCDRLFPSVTTDTTVTTAAGACQYSNEVCAIYAYIGRHPDKIDAPGAAYWQGKLDAGTSLAQAQAEAREFVRRADEVAQRKGLPDSQTLLNGTPEQQQIYFDEIAPEL